MYRVTRSIQCHGLIYGYMGCVLVLDPMQKSSHFDKYWTADEKEEAMKVIEAKFKARYTQLYEELSDDEDTSSSPVPVVESSEPWRKEFRCYLDCPEELRGHAIIQWWGYITRTFTPFGRPARLRPRLRLPVDRDNLF
ncbi:hypothetical protein NEOLEDRAFT_1144918 [Neolentinus lepideus HHB14362 ss-1]|uniref:Uncharacterized protein n=1 Tax=Neolentinus lepideus HHB14362 ss-1 TaxID=1314782 RepID=A0A165VLA2_9AGAM|nr:hypothetical protein NEOLEDRAFT_1144918 [Neolentinus lepideus HHB14362 ss-1]